MELHPNADTALTGISPAVGRRPNNSSMRPWAPRGEIEFTFTVFAVHAPALRSAIDEISNAVGGRLTGAFIHSKESALTDAAIALASLRKEVFSKVPAGDPNYV